MASRKPTAKTIAFGTELIRLREQAGLTRADLAKRVHVSRSYIGQVETGTARCRQDFAQRLDDGLGTGTAMSDAWDDLLRSAAYPIWFADYPVAESSAELLRSYVGTFVVGLLQIEEYARVLLAADELALEGRLRRQQVLTRKPPPRLVVVLEESVLAREVGGPEVMRAQCEHLVQVAQWENVTLQIAPPAYYRGVAGTFSIATQSTGENLLYQETSTGGVTSNDAGDILHCVSAFAEMQARCLSVGDSCDLIRKVAERWAM